MPATPRQMLFIGWFFFLLSSGLVAFGIGALVDNLRFRSGASQASGEVIRLQWVHDAGAHPVVRYEFQGRQVEFHSRLSADPPAYKVGERVTVFYHPEAPEDARIDSAVDRYIGPLVFAGGGSLFWCFGFAVLILPRILERRRRRIKERGVSVQAKVTAIRRGSSSEDGPWFLLAEFTDEITGKPYVATSQWIWIDPREQYPVGSNVTVYCLPDEPKKNMFQLDRLPELL
jgi:hypothetical protein